MIKKLFLGVLGLLVLALLWSWITYPKVGEVSYAVDMTVESNLAGLSETNYQLGEFNYSVYQTDLDNQKPVVLLLHGFSADKTVWVRFAKYLTDEYRVIIPDMAGHGATNFITGADYSPKGQAIRLLQLLDTLKIAKVAVAGNSMGGYIAAELARQAPTKVSSVGLFDAAGVTAPVDNEFQQQVAAGKNPFLISSREDFEKFYPMTMASPPLVPGFVLDAKADDYIARKPELAEIFPQIHNAAKFDKTLAEFKTPTWIVWGEKDRLLDVSMAKVWQQIPDSELKLYPKLGHMPMVESPEETATDYLAFLAKR